MNEIQKKKKKVATGTCRAPAAFTLHSMSSIPTRPRGPKAKGVGPGPAPTKQVTRKLDRQKHHVCEPGRAVVVSEDGGVADCPSVFSRNLLPHLLSSITGLARRANVWTARASVGLGSMTTSTLALARNSVIVGLLLPKRKKCRER